MRAAYCLAALAVLLLGCDRGGPANPRVRNAVLICIDTIRYDTLALIHEVERGDEASRWWERGTRLTRAQSTAPWTLPAVASAFTGRYPNEHAAGRLPGPIADITKAFPLPLAEGLPTLPEALSRAGFETAGFVAHPWFRQLYGLQRGFATLNVEHSPASAVISRSEAWLAARADRSDPRPFFLYLHFMDAHGPRLEEQDTRERAARLSAALRERAAAANPAACAEPASLACLNYLGYIEAVQSVRAAVAHVLESLEANGLLASTAVVVFADHGEEFQDHAREEAEHDLDPRDLYGEGHGHTLYQEQLHVPLALWHPALAPGERAIPASLVDVAPTLLGWLGVAPGWRVAGVDLGPALAGEAPIDPERALFSSSLAVGPEREAVLSGSRKRISDGGAGALFFDLARDPRERSPASDPALTSLDALLAGYRGARAPSGEPARPTPRQLEELQALGYLGEARVE